MTKIIDGHKVYHKLHNIFKMPEIISTDPNIPNMVVHPDPRLYQVADKVEGVDDEIRSDVEKMTAALKQHDGIGLGGPQIGIMKQIAICCIDYFLKIDKESWISDETLDKEYCVLLNPEVIEVSDEMMTNKEGCLSLPGVYVPISRPKKVKIKFRDMEWKEHMVEVNGFLAANFQHEIDHVNGITLISKLSGLKKAMQIKKLEKNLKNLKIKY